MRSRLEFRVPSLDEAHLLQAELVTKLPEIKPNTFNRLDTTFNLLSAPLVALLYSYVYKKSLSQQSHFTRIITKLQHRQHVHSPQRI